MKRSLNHAAALLFMATLAVGLARPAAADEPVPDKPNECPNPGGQGNKCSSESGCALNTYATICVQHTPGDPSSRKCEIPCEKKVGQTNVFEQDRSACAIGETCIEGKKTPGVKSYYCKASAFRVDLNLLDQAVVYHLEGMQPAFGEGKCSLEANLSALLDQNGDKAFDIFDLDLCVLAFLEQPGCDPETATCGQKAPDEEPSCDPFTMKCEAVDLVPCLVDDDCGSGLYCDSQRYACQRDCGDIAAREEGFGKLERQCSGALKVCNLERGQCVKIDVSQMVCEVDSQCPSGSYCLVGRCAPHCYQSADCPGTDWYCSENNRCRALGQPATDSGFEFDPKNYAIRFVRDQLQLNAVLTSDGSQVVVMDLVSKRQVIDNPSVAFGYRMEVKYNLKQDPKCLKPFVDCNDPEKLVDGETKQECQDRQDDCYVDESERWMQFLSPFGTLNAVGHRSVDIALDKVAAGKLMPGTYSAVIQAIFDNGDSDRLDVLFVKASPSGEYSGILTTYFKGLDNLLNGLRPLVFDMRLKLTDKVVQWNELLKENNLATEELITDLTSGKVVVGSLHGNTALAFSAGGALSEAENEIPFVGIYSPDLGTIHLIGVIEIAKDFCITEDGEDCAGLNPVKLSVRNLFGRKIRRTIEFTGPFDSAQAMFHGIYRERIYGLQAKGESSVVTLEGGFRMVQVVADDSPLAQPKLLAKAETVSYPTADEVLSALEADIEKYCSTGNAAVVTSAAWAAKQFESEATFKVYLKQAKRAGPPNEASVLGKTTIFPALLQFDDMIEEALSTLGSDLAEANPLEAEAIQQQHLNIYDFVSSRLLPCDPTDPSPPPVCIDENAVRCGLALHQKAILSGWISVNELSGADGDFPIDGEQELFCVDTIPVDGCPDKPGIHKALFVLQEHNRFWRDFEQILKLDADRARTDAFLVMFRNEVDPFAEGAALSYKSESLKDSIRRYDAAFEAIVGPAAGKVLFRWPARAFKQKGRAWLKIMHTLVQDRMGVLAELVDLERRIFGVDMEYMFAQHMMQQEFLGQVYLMFLQATWEDEEFQYAGEGGQVLEQGQKVLNQVNPLKNQLGVQPGVVYFENTDTTSYPTSVSNWRFYRNIVAGKEADGGLIGSAKLAVGDAVANLQGALADLDALQASLMESKFALEDKLAEMCGDPNPGDPAGQTDDYCQYLLKKYADSEDWLKIAECKFDASASNCPKGFQFTCPEFSNDLMDGENTCQSAVATFVAGYGGIIDNDFQTGDDLIAKPPTCALDKDVVTIQVNGKERPCVGGQMAQLLQQRANLEVQRNTVVGSVETVLKGVKAKISAFKAIYDSNQDLLIAWGVMNGVIAGLDVGIAIAETVDDSAEIIAKSLGCMVIAGFAVGTDCPMKAAAGTVETLASNAAGAVKMALTIAKVALAYAYELGAKIAAQHQAGYSIAGDVLEAVTAVDPLIDQFNVLTQAWFDVGTQIEDMRYQAQFAADRYKEKIEFAADHLVGRESGYVLKGDALVKDASSQFQDIVQYSYRMVQAFIHHYNLTEGDAEWLRAMAYQMVTLEDAQALVELLDKWALEYCGKEAIDCDWDYSANAKVVRYSLRDRLFPGLHDIVDGKTGKVTTAGQQFHNLITQAPYVKRRIRGVLETDQIELPFALPVTLQENTAKGAQWLIDPLECNQHLLAGEWEAVPPFMEGTVAVQVLGKNLGDGAVNVIAYELARGGIDYIRACHAESTVQEIGTMPVLDYPILKHMVGYAPQSVQGQKDAVPAFVTHSQGLSACLAEEESGPPDQLICWKYFGRDRSLAAPDYKMILPIVVGGGTTENAWIMGDGLKEADKPVIEDIVLYFRYYSRPIDESM